MAIHVNLRDPLLYKLEDGRSCGRRQTHAAGNEHHKPIVMLGTKCLHPASTDGRSWMATDVPIHHICAVQTDVSAVPRHTCVKDGPICSHSAPALIMRLHSAVRLPRSDASTEGDMRKAPRRQTCDCGCTAQIIVMSRTTRVRALLRSRLGLCYPPVPTSMALTRANASSITLDLRRRALLCL
jgi:hypothetical protein